MTVQVRPLTQARVLEAVVPLNAAVRMDRMDDREIWPSQSQPIGRFERAKERDTASAYRYGPCDPVELKGMGIRFDPSARVPRASAAL